MTQEEFHKKYTKIRPFVKGNGRRIADKAGIPYSQYLNSLTGAIRSSEILEKIYSAMIVYSKEKAENLLASIEEHENSTL